MLKMKQCLLKLIQFKSIFKNMYRQICRVCVWLISLSQLCKCRSPFRTHCWKFSYIFMWRNSLCVISVWIFVTLCLKFGNSIGTLRLIKTFCNCETNLATCEMCHKFLQILNQFTISDFSIWFQFWFQHLLPEKFDSKSMYIRSTDLDRTLQSAEYNLAGQCEFHIPHKKNF